MLFPDLLQRLLPFPIRSWDRARALEQSFEATWDVFRGEVEVYAAEKAGEGKDAVRLAGARGLPELSAPYDAYWDPENDPYAFAAIFNTTEMETGQRRIVSPFRFVSPGSVFFPIHDKRCWASAPGKATAQSPSLITAAILSARFPWITPAAEVRVAADVPACRPYRSQSFDTDGKDDDHYIRLVDGAYFENSGTSTALDLVEALVAAAGTLGIADRIEVHVIATVTRAATTGGAFSRSELLGPASALLNTSGTRGNYEIDRLRQRFALARQSGRAADTMLGDLAIVELELAGFPLPLGWQLAPTTQALIDLQVAKPSRCGEANADWLAWDAAGRTGSLPGHCALRAAKERLTPR